MARAKSTVLEEKTAYLPQYLIDDRGHDATGECSLFVRHYTLVETPSGKRKLKIALDVESYPDEDAMVAAIEERGLTELPAEADGRPEYVPEEFDRPGITVEREFSHKRVRGSREPKLLRRGLTTFHR